MNPVQLCWAPIGLRRLKAGVAVLKGITNPTAFTAIAAILAAAALVTGCANPGSLPAALPALSASAAGLDANATTAFSDETWWHPLDDPKLNALIEQALAGLDRALRLNQVQGWGDPGDTLTPPPASWHQTPPRS